MCARSFAFGSSNNEGQVKQVFSIYCISRKSYMWMGTIYFSRIINERIHLLHPPQNAKQMKSKHWLQRVWNHIRSQPNSVSVLHLYIDIVDTPPPKTGLRLYIFGSHIWVRWSSIETLPENTLIKKFLGNLHQKDTNNEFLIYHLRTKYWWPTYCWNHTL